MQWLRRRLIDDTIARLRVEQAEAAEIERSQIEPIAVLVTAAFVLTLQNYGFVRNGFVHSLVANNWLGTGLATELNRPENSEIARLAIWSIGCVVTYLFIPAAVGTIIRRRTPTDYGLGFRGIIKDGWIYGVMFLCVVPAIWFASRQESFLSTYPFYQLSAKESLWPRLLGWELLYALQFVALEYFFRGFLTLGLRRRLGIYSVFVMMVPYCMIHFGKPMLETLGAIIAGIVLGWMSLKTRSIWPGAALHIAVAWSMDFAAMLQHGR